MQAMQALVIMEHELTELLTKAGKVAALEVLEDFRQELNQDPVLKHADRLRSYIENRSLIDNPRDLWSNGRHIRLITPTKNGKPKSIAWFQTFKKESNLKNCVNRPSPDHGRLQEWCFEDIANAWDHYHRQRYMRQA